MQLAMRPYRAEDHGRVREFLRDVLLRNAGRERSWPVYRWDYWRWHGTENIWRVRLEDVVSLWETADGRIASAHDP